MQQQADDDSDVVLVQCVPYSTFEEACGFKDHQKLLRQLQVDLPRQNTIVNGRSVSNVTDITRLLAGSQLMQFCTQAALSYTFGLFHTQYCRLPDTVVVDSTGSRATYVVQRNSLTIEKSFDILDVPHDRLQARIDCTTDIQPHHGAMISWYVTEFPHVNVHGDRWLAAAFNFQWFTTEGGGKKKPDTGNKKASRR